MSENTEPYKESRKTYEYDPHLDPQLQWAGKAEHTSFEVPTRSLHVHERIDPKTIINTVQKEETGQVQISLFESEKKPLREAIEFYKHKEGWSNRLIAGDSLLVMNSLLEKEGMACKVQMIYIDPPYGIKYGSNFQPFVNKRDVTDRKDEDLTAEPEMIKAFRDTWELGIHSYLSYLRDRLLLARELLHESGSVFVQISDENVHRVRCLMDEVFGVENFVSQIIFKTTAGKGSKGLDRINDVIIWYARKIEQLKYHQLFIPRNEEEDNSRYNWIDKTNGEIVKLFKKQMYGIEPVPEGRRFRITALNSQGETTSETSKPFEWKGNIYYPPRGRHWSITQKGLQSLANKNRLILEGKNLCYKRYLDDYPVTHIKNVWMDTGGGALVFEKVYVVQTTQSTIQRCLLMTTDPGDLVFDPTCGSGTTAYVAEQWGRRWVTCDTSRVALTLAKQRLMTANFNYYQLAHPNEGVGSGFVYKTVPHITLKSIANNEPSQEETLYDQPKVDNKKARITGPFTVEAVPAPAVKPLEQSLVSSFEFSEKATTDTKNQKLKTENYAGNEVARSGETLRQSQWRDELLKAGVRAKGGSKLEFTRVEPMSGTRWIQASGECLVASDQGKGTNHSSLITENCMIVFGPEHAPLEQRMVENAWQEAKPFKPDILLFCAFQFDDEAAKDIDELKPEIAGMQLLKVQMNADLFTDDLKKKRSGNDSFWLIGQPDVSVVSEQWLVNSEKKRIMHYELCKKLSGLDSLAEINRIGRKDISFYAAVAKRRDLWDSIANEEGCGFDSVEHSGRTSEKRNRRVPTISEYCKGVSCRIGNSDNFVRKVEACTSEQRQRIIERLRRNKQIVDRSAKITAHSPLTTVHYSQVEVLGFDYYNPKTGNVDSGGKGNIAMWLLDTNYDDRSLFPSQVFFPMAGAKDGWSRLARNLKAEIDEEKIEAFKGTVSLPFEKGDNAKIAVKIIDDRGIESLRVISLNSR